MRVKSALNVALLAVALAGAGALAGCNQEKNERPEPVSPAAPAAPSTGSAPTTPSGASGGTASAPAPAKGGGTAKLPKEAVCPVCAVKEGKRELEPVKASLVYKGKTYYFCNLDDKAEFISNPEK